ncbi:MAG: polysaccharide deacetylase family protein [Ancalomicrobiaceae bacterium]|nr:polysaccharide deacetylase family protein [Ancalomicrobiaceae bacterium]
MTRTIRGAVPAMTLGLAVFVIGTAAGTFAQNAPLELAPGKPQATTVQSPDPTDPELLKKKPPQKPAVKPATPKPTAKPTTAAPSADKAKVAAKPTVTKPAPAPKKPTSLETLTAQAAVPQHDHVIVDVPPAPCPGNPDAIGLSRIIEVDTTGGFYAGQTYRTRMPLLQPKEVILTFDDGPRPVTTDRVLAALKNECVKATFFMIGQMAKAYPAEARKVAAAGMSIGYHTMTHTYQLKSWPLEKSQAEIVGGWKAVDDAIWGKSSDTKPTSHFFRYPGLFNSHVVNTWFNQIDMGVFAIDAAGNDWIKGYITDSEAPNVMNRALMELEHQNGGILLLHDIKGSSSNAVAPLLRELKKRGFKIVHIVQKQPLPPLASGPAPAGVVDTAPAPINERNISGFDVSRQLGQEQLGKVGTPSAKPAPLPAYQTPDTPAQPADPTVTKSIASTPAASTSQVQPMPAPAPKHDDGWFGSTASTFRGIGTAIGLW